MFKISKHVDITTLGTTTLFLLVKGYPVSDGVVNASRVSFARFASDPTCSHGVFAVGNNPLSPDAVHPMQMTGTSKYNVDLNSLAFYYEPKPEWIVQEVHT